MRSFALVALGLLAGTASSVACGAFTATPVATTPDGDGGADGDAPSRDAVPRPPCKADLASSDPVCAPFLSAPTGILGVTANQSNVF